MADSFTDLGRKLDQLAQHLDGRALRELTTRVAVAAKKDGEREIERDLGSDRRFSGWKRVRLGVGFDLLHDGAAVVKPRPNGPSSVLDGGRKPGSGAPRRGRRGVRVLSTPWGPRSYSKAKPLRVGGTRGKGTWKRTTNDIERETPGRVNDEVVAQMRRLFGG